MCDLMDVCSGKWKHTAAYEAEVGQREREITQVFFSAPLSLSVKKGSPLCMWESPSEQFCTVHSHMFRQLPQAAKSATFVRNPPVKPFIGKEAGQRLGIFNQKENNTFLQCENVPLKQNAPNRL